MERRDKINYYLDIAEAVTGRGTCLRRNFGAVIVKNDTIISTGYVGAPRGRANCNELHYCTREKLQVPRGERYELCRSVHAEQNAIINASRSEMLGATLYLVGLENRTGGYVEAGLAIAELLSGMKTPTVSLVLGGGHSIGVPLAVSTRYSFIAPTATMTVHPVRMNGVMLGVPQTLSYFDKMQERITGFVTANSRIRPEKFRELMMNNGELVMDIGTVLDGEGAVQVGLIDELGGLQDALGKLYDLIDEEDGRKKPRRGRPPKAKPDKEPPAKGAAK